ncbi:tetratricopeptide repeat protein [Oxalobacteraceae bacterium]|nr:tetratricopeptide repeat protein [Oxalobacteraceae bacterium]
MARSHDIGAAPVPGDDAARRAYLSALGGEAMASWPALAAASHRRGDRVALFERAAEIVARGDALAALQVLAQWHHEAGETALAEAVLREVLRRAPAMPGAMANLGLMLSTLGRPQEAVELHRRALALQPDLAAAWGNLALALRALGDDAGAADAEQAALRLAPHSPEAHINAGLALYGQGRILESMAAYRHALQLRHDLPEAWINLGIALQDVGDASAACEAFERALALAPHDQRAASNLLMAMQYAGQFDAAGLRQAATRCGTVWGGGGQVTPFPAPSSILRVGYLGGDFRQHPVGWMLLPVLHGHDRARVKIHCFDTRPDTGPADPITLELRQASDQWHKVGALDDAALAALIRANGIDVLVDLAGHTAGARLGALALRAAPVQLSWLGYFASTGLAEVDAVVIGGAVAGEGAAQYYTEALEVLPRLHMSYTAPSYAPPVAPCPSPRHGALTFGSFNNTAKLSDEVVRLWSRVLTEVADSRLVLKWKCFADPGFGAHTLQRFARHGVAPQRIDLRPHSPHADMLAEYGDIDLALDTFPFSGGLTSLEALWMGVPVLTMPWLRPVSRQTLAMLEALGLADLAAPTPGAFVALACALAADLPRRQALRADLRERMRASVLSDGAGLARALESIYFTRRAGGA